MEAGEDLVEQPFQRLIQDEQLIAFKYDGYWNCMDTFKDRQQLDELYTRGEAPWEVWKSAKNGQVESALEKSNGTRRRKGLIINA